MSFTESLDELVLNSPNALLGKHASWERVRLAEVAAVLNGFAFPSSGFNRDEGIGLIRIRDINTGSTEAKFAGEFDAEYLVDRGDLLVGMDGDFNCSIWSGDPALLNQRVCKITTHENLYRKKFLYYALPGYLQAINQSTSSITVKHLSSRTVQDIPLPLPAVEEQDRIVEEIEKQFTRVDAATAALKRVQANLKRYRASVLKAACEGRLVPTEAELARKEGRDYEPADQLLQRIVRERRARWEADTLAKMIASGKPPKDDRWRLKYKVPMAPDTTNLPDLPEGWCWAAIGQVFTVHVGATPSRGIAEYWNGDVRWVSSGEVAFCRITSTRESITSLGLRRTSTSLHPAGTVLLGMIGEGKTRGQAAILDIEACNNQNSAAIRVSEAGLPPEYLYRFLEGVYERTRTLGSGNNQPALNKSRVEEIVFPLPPLQEQQRIVAETERVLSIVAAVESSHDDTARKSAALRNGILKRAFSGKLVSQDLVDESASILLERIRDERAPKAKPSARPKRQELVHA